MKRLFTIVLLQLLSIGLFGQVCLKGICLGEKGVDRKAFPQTVGGIQGVIITQTLGDGRIYRIGFMPGTEESPKHVYPTDADDFVAGVESNFGVKLNYSKFTPEDPNSFYNGTLTKMAVSIM